MRLKSFTNPASFTVFNFNLSILVLSRKAKSLIVNKLGYALYREYLVLNNTKFFFTNFLPKGSFLLKRTLLATGNLNLKRNWLNLQWRDLLLITVRQAEN